MVDLLNMRILKFLKNVQAAELQVYWYPGYIERLIWVVTGIQSHRALPCDKIRRPLQGWKDLCTNKKAAFQVAITRKSG